MAIRKVCKWRLLQLLQLEMHRPWLTSASQRSNLQPWGHPEHESCLTFAKRTSTGGGRVEPGEPPGGVREAVGAAVNGIQSNRDR
ncbi:hypothetical protein WJX74_004596 [Apatococcus lobatus]|uniref:Secreted protein n=1 Tax=Apatococcus lobatus TaxID=904363 RepID=A0AAW1SBI6_9CHLO